MSLLFTRSKSSQRAGIPTLDNDMRASFDPQQVLKAVHDLEATTALLSQSKDDIDSPVWTTREGHKVKVHKMTDSHLQYAHRFVRRRIDHFLAIAHQMEWYLAQPLKPATRTRVRHIIKSCYAIMAKLEWWAGVFAKDLDRRGLVALPL